MQGMHNGAVEVQGCLCEKSHGQADKAGEGADTPTAAADGIGGDSHGAADRDAPKKAGQGAADEVVADPLEGLGM